MNDFCCQITLFSVRHQQNLLRIEDLPHLHRNHSTPSLYEVLQFSISSRKHSRNYWMDSLSYQSTTLYYFFQNNPKCQHIIVPSWLSHSCEMHIESVSIPNSLILDNVSYLPSLQQKRFHGIQISEHHRICIPLDILSEWKQLQPTSY